MIVQRGIINCFLDVIFLPISSHAHKTSYVGPIICLHITSVIVTFCLNISNHLQNYGILGIGTECTNAYTSVCFLLVEVYTC